MEDSTSEERLKMYSNKASVYLNQPITGREESSKYSTSGKYNSPLKEYNSLENLESDHDRNYKTSLKKSGKMPKDDDNFDFNFNNSKSSRNRRNQNYETDQSSSYEDSDSSQSSVVFSRARKSNHKTNKRATESKRNTRSKYNISSDDERSENSYSHKSQSYSKTEKIRTLKIKEKEYIKRLTKLEKQKRENDEKIDTLTQNLNNLLNLVNYKKDISNDKYISNTEHDPYSRKENLEGNSTYNSFQRYEFGDFSQAKIKRIGKTYPEVIWAEYDEHPNLKAISQDEADQIRSNNNIFVQAPDNLPIPTPVTRFDINIFPDYIMEYIKKNQFKTPSPIQMQTWPLIMSSYDVLAIAETGSGKTLAFLIPSFLHIIRQEPIRSGDGPICLILSPTRELAIQISEVTKELCDLMDKEKNNQLKVHCSFGSIGISLRKEYNDKISGKADILVASPGRLYGLLQNADFDLGRASFLVIDEADKMFGQDTIALTKYLSTNASEDRQTLFFSASWDNILNETVNILSKRPCFKVSTNAELKTKAVKSITQVIHLSMKGQIKLDYKIKVIQDEINQLDNKQALIFCDTRIDTGFVMNKIKQAISDKNVDYIHGGLEQETRRSVMKDFSSKKIDVLISSDLLQRGIDINSVGLVVNFTCPRTFEQYTHRIGRTGRSGRKGRSITFVEHSRDNLLETLKIEDPYLQIVNY